MARHVALGEVARSLSRLPRGRHDDRLEFRRALQLRVGERSHVVAFCSQGIPATRIGCSRFGVTMGCTIVFHDNIRIFELKVADDFLLARNRCRLGTERHNFIQKRLLRAETSIVAREKSEERQLSFLHRRGFVAKMPRHPPGLIGTASALVAISVSREERLRRDGRPHVDDCTNVSSGEATYKPSATFTNDRRGSAQLTWWKWIFFSEQRLPFTYGTKTYRQPSAQVPIPARTNSCRTLWPLALSICRTSRFEPAAFLIIETVGNENDGIRSRAKHFPE